jgi:hypothetical protein
MEALLYLDLSTGTLSETLSGSRFNWPKLTFGDTISLGLRFAKRQAGVISEVSRDVQSLSCSIGHKDLRPEHGTWGFKIGADNADSLIDLAHNSKGSPIATAINALTLPAGLGTATVEERTGSWLIRFADETTASTDTPVTIVSYGSNTLFPTSHVKHDTFQEGGQWVHELRLVQSPVASTSSSSRVQPPPPEITTLQNGGEDVSSGATWNEVQDLYIPPSFRGLYQLKRGFKRTGLLSLADGITEISAALETIADEDGIFIVTNPETDHAHIEFTGDMAATDQDPLEVVVYSAPEGDLTFHVDLNRNALAALLRKDAEVTLPIEIYASITDENDALTDRSRKLYQSELVIQRELHWDGLATAQDIDWLRPPLPEEYGGFDYSQINSGIIHYADSYGTGVATAIVVDHNLASEDVDVIVKDNDTGLLLVLGTDYTVTVTNANSLTVTSLIGAPTTDQWRIAVAALGEASSFDPHTHLISEVTGLQAILDSLGTRLDALELLAPSTVTLTRSTTSAPSSRYLGSVWTVPRTRRNPDKPATLIDWRISAKEMGEKPRNPLRLLPAVHDASVETIPAAPLPVPSSTYAGRVFTTATARTDFPGGGLLAGDFAACDGREWYRVARIGSESSYYPVEFETMLFETMVNSSEFPLGSQLDLDIGLEAMVLMLEAKARSRRSACSWSFILEAGAHTADSTPGTPGSNLASGFSSAVTLLEQRIVLTEIPSYHTFGVSVARSAAGVLTATARKYGDETATTAPASANFALRGSFIRFDTENSPTDARGIVALRGLDVGLNGQPDTALGRLVITK